MPSFRNFIHKLHESLLSGCVINLLLAMAITVFLCSMFHRYIYIDDAFFGEQAFYFSKDGVARIPSLPGFLGCDQQLFSYHKLNIALGALSIHVFGWSLNALRMITIFFYLLLVYNLTLYYKTIRKTHFPNENSVAILLLITCPIVLLHGFTYRPEIWVACFGFMSFYHLEKHFEYPKRNANLILAGVMAGLSFLTHLNGIAFMASGFLVLLFRKDFRGCVLYGISATVIAGFYFWDLWQPEHFRQWIFQLANWPDNNITSYKSRSFIDLVFHIVNKLFSEHERFFWSYKVWAISSLFLASVLFRYKRLSASMNNVLVYTFWLILTVNILGSQIAERYLIYLIPFLCILIAHSITAPLTEKAFSFKIVYTLLLLFQLGTFVAMAVDIFSKNQDYNALHEQILKHIPVKNATVLAPYQFIFEAIPGQNMVSFKRIEYEQALNHHELNQEEIFARAMAYHVNYVIIPRKGLICENASLNAFDQHPILPDSLYHEIYSDQFAVILQRTETGK